MPLAYRAQIDGAWTATRPDGRQQRLEHGPLAVAQLPRVRGGGALSRIARLLVLG
jgi:hypothetical protein